MVQLDESNIEIQWHCPPCEKLENPRRKEADPLAPAHIPRPAATPPLVTKPSKVTPPRQVVLSTAGNPPPSRTVAHRAVQPARAPKIVAGRMPPTATPPAKMTTVTQNGKNPPGRLAFPDCKIRDLPFFPVKSTLLRPCNLAPKDSTQEAQQQNLAFYLTQEQANCVNNGRKVETNGMVVYKMHILLRFTKAASDNVHDDDFPKNLCLKVNNKICPLPNPKPVPANRPNMEAKRPPKPLIITSLCKLNTKSCLNQISITWTPTELIHTVSIYLVEKLNPADLLSSLKGRGQRDPEITRTLIRSKLEDKDSDEIATTSCKVTMSCPLGMARMTYPARASTCDHLQCFDADTYLRMNEKKPKWVCPVCNKPAYFDSLFLDGFYIQLLQSPKFRALSTNDIVLNQDATWEPVISEGVGVSDNSEDEDPLAVPVNKPSTYQSLGDPDIIAITPEVDADGAPILSQLSQLPIASRVPPSTQGTVPMVNGTSKSKADSDFISDHEIAPEDDFVDLNFSIKFFQFIRAAPEKPVPAVVEAVTEPSKLPPSTAESPVVPPLVIAKPKPPAKPVAKPRGGAKAPRGRPRGGGSTKAKRYDTDEYSSDDEPKKKKAKRGGGRGGGGGAARGRGGAAGARKPRYRDDSHEESSESEEEVLKRPVVSSTGRPSRNCRRSTNYADIEKAGDVLDYLLN